MIFHRFLQYSSGVEPVLVLEDLTARNFATPQSALNLDASITAIHKLAKFHAASIYLAKDVRVSLYNSEFLIL